jgi:hypothetical protein
VLPTCPADLAGVPPLEKSCARLRRQTGRLTPTARFIFGPGSGQHGKSFSRQIKGSEETRVTAMLACPHRNQQIEFCILQAIDGVTNGKVRGCAFSGNAHHVPRH